jgi:hypothetical protein
MIPGMLRTPTLPPATGGSSRPSRICKPKHPRAVRSGVDPCLNSKRPLCAPYGTDELGQAHGFLECSDRALWDASRPLNGQRGSPVLASAGTRGPVAQGAIMRMKPTGRTERRFVCAFRVPCLRACRRRDGARPVVRGAFRLRAMLRLVFADRTLCVRALADRNSVPSKTDTTTTAGS